MTQTGPDLVSAGFPTSRPVASLLGTYANQLTQTNLPARTNLDYAFGNVTDGALAASGVVKSVAVPVVPGDVITQLIMFVGATAASTPTHGFAALYSGIAVPARLNQSVDSTTGAVAASAAYKFTIPATTVTSVNAPNGFIYASISFTGTAVNTAMSFLTTTATGYQLDAGETTPLAPLFVCATHGSAVVGTAPATIASPTAATPAPVVVLR